MDPKRENKSIKANELANQQAESLSRCADVLEQKGFRAQATAMRQANSDGLYVLRKSEYLLYRFYELESAWDLTKEADWSSAFFTRESAEAQLKRMSIAMIRYVFYEKKSNLEGYDRFLCDEESAYAGKDIEKGLQQIFNKSIRFAGASSLYGPNRTRAFSHPLLDRHTRDEQIWQTLELFGAKLFEIVQVPIMKGDLQ